MMIAEMLAVSEKSRISRKHKPRTGEEERRSRRKSEKFRGSVDVLLAPVRGRGV